MKLAANLSTLFTEWPLFDRPRQAAQCGFEGVEFQFLDDQQQAMELAKQIEVAALDVVLLNAPCGDRSREEIGLAGIAGAEARFERAVADGLEMCLTLKISALHVLSERIKNDVLVADQWRLLVANMRNATREAAKHDIVVMVEPLNERSSSGYLLPTLEAAVRLQDDVGEPNLKIQFDLFHLQIMGGDILSRFASVAPRVGHVQLASVPHRDEPDRGELAYERVLDAIVEGGYDGWIGCEYYPRAGTVDGLGWAKRYGISKQ